MRLARIGGCRIQLALLTAITLLTFATVVPAQEPRVQHFTAPPPAKTIPAEERKMLSSITDNKKRVKKTIELSEERLTKAEAHTSQEQFSEASAEMGKYWALIDDILRHLGTLKRDSNKTRDLYKRVELALRAHGPKLTSLRRNTPLEYAVWIKEIEELARAGRTEALNSFYGQTVIREPKSATAKPSEKRAKDGSNQPENKQP